MLWYAGCTDRIASLRRFSDEIGELEVNNRSALAPLKAQGGLGHFCRFMSVLFWIDPAAWPSFPAAFSVTESREVKMTSHYRTGSDMI
jgi:hypothetical protein